MMPVGPTPPPAPVNPAIIQERIKQLMRNGQTQTGATQQAVGPQGAPMPAPPPPPPPAAPMPAPAPPMPMAAPTPPVAAPSAQTGTTAPMDGGGVGLRQPRKGAGAAQGPGSELESIMMAQQKSPGVPY